MNKIELIDKVALKARITKKDAADVVDAVFETLLEALESGDFAKVAGFGRFEVKARKGRDGMNPVTKDVIRIPAQNAIVFHASKPAKDRVNSK